jgi:signal peptidase I
VWNEVKSLVKSIAIFLIIAFTLRASVVEAFKIPSSSMVPTLEVGDHILVNKLSYGIRLPFRETTLMNLRPPQRGDVVVFTLPDDPTTPEINESEINIIKRIIGLEGDTIEVRGEYVYINGERYHEESVKWLDHGRKNFGPITVPEGKVLLLGDNRDRSKDSRYWTDPFVDTERIKGRAFVIYWSWHSLKRIFDIIR